MGKLLTIILLLVAIQAQGQGHRAELRADTTALQLGGQTWIHLQTVRDPALSSDGFVWPALKDTLPGGWEVLEVRDADTSLVAFADGRDGIAITRSLRVTTWDSGFVRMPELPFVLGGDTLWSNALLFAVEAPVLGEEGTIANHHDVVDVEWTLLERLLRALPWAFGILAFAAAVWGGVRWWRRRAVRSVGPMAAAVSPVEPAHAVALRALREVKERASWKQGNPKGHHSAVSTILRAYLEQRFGLAALEQTTGDIARSLRAADLDANLRRQVLDVLEFADLVKFAKHRGEADDHERAVLRAIEFVERTRPAAGGESAAP